MKIGYACICLDAQFHFETCIQKFATEDRLRSIIRANLETLQKLLEYNAAVSYTHLDVYKRQALYGIRYNGTR